MSGRIVVKADAPTKLFRRRPWHGAMARNVINAGMDLSSNRLVVLLLLGLLASGAEHVQAQPRPPTIATAAVMTGTVRLYVLNEFGDVDGLLSREGWLVRFPPHMSADLVRTLAPGDRFTASGEGDEAHGFRAFSIGKPGHTPLTEARPSTIVPRRSPAERATALKPLSVEGTVIFLLPTPRGDTEGAVLDDGIVVRFAPRRPAIEALRIGDRLAARGDGTRNRYGTALRAQAIGIAGRPLVPLQPPGPELPRPVP